jgi:hypothetical protein
MLAFKNSPRVPDQEINLPDSSYSTMVTYFRVSGDEGNPVKAIRSIWDEAGGRIELDEDDNLTPNMWPTIYNYSLKRAWRACGKIFQSFGLFLAFLTPFSFFLVLFVGGIAVTIAVADMAGGHVVLSHTSRAGSWKIDVNSPGFVGGDGSVINEDLQRRIWDYKDRCYGSSLANSDCDMFYKANIGSIANKDVPCPFYGDVCFYGEQQGGYERTTGLLDSNILGINAEASKRFHFSKTIVCAPLRVDENYVIPEGETEYPNQYLYDYGPSNAGSYILDGYTYRNPMEWKMDGWFQDTLSYTLS